MRTPVALSSFSVFLLALAFAVTPNKARAEGAKLFVTSPLPIILGETDEISLVIEAPETPETEGRPLQVAVNVGRIDPPERVGRGKYRAHYHLPPTKFPQAAIVAVWRETGAEADVDFLRIPLSARTKLPFKTKPGAEVRVFISDERFGPVSADRKGQATIPIIVPPGVREVDVESVAGLDRQKSSVVVKVPPYNRLGMAVSPYLVAPPGGAGEAYATVHVYFDDQKAPPATAIKMNAAGGDAKLVGAKGSRYTYRVSPKGGAKEIKLNATVDGDAQANASATILIGVPIAERILSRTSSTSMAANGSSTKVIRALAVDHYGLGVPGQTINAVTSAGTLSKPRDNGSGYYEVTLTAPDNVPKNKKARVTVSVTTPSGSPISVDFDTPLLGGGGSTSNTGTPEVAEVEAPARPSQKSETPFFSLGAAIGGTYDAQFAPMGQIEFALHPNVLNRRLGIFAAIGFRTMSREFGIDGYPGLKSSLTRLPITAGVTYDFYAKGSGRGYAGVAGGAAGLAHKVEANFQDAVTYRRVVPTAELIAGGQYAGVFFELAGIYMPVSDEALKVPSIGFSAALGYRLGLF